MTKLKREQIENQARDIVKKSNVENSRAEKDEEKLKMVFEEDGVYQEVYNKLFN